jgi:transcriptional regulator with XRE-family HTH domain
MTKPLNLVGPAVRRLRNAKKLSQEKLAAKCQLIGWDITREGIAKIEGQVRHVDDLELRYLCKVLRVKADFLIGL